jgi:hypothetical protein
MDFGEDLCLSFISEDVVNIPILVISRKHIFKHDLIHKNALATKKGPPCQDKRLINTGILECSKDKKIYSQE